ncbi:hypothetical protein GCM10023219_08830 [Stakelama sediminis]|uniref:ATP synthase subunit b n=1 Tax=Stakelama sediminis TaxID=463200 RepID=A0A840YVM5_9SPHN|nr:hypothetical protein [Stakelama sediminis]MBB5717605.1 F-type H+-transporting ATPase subunit b [Stakelama sediminis]
MMMVNTEHVVDAIDAHQTVGHGAHGPELLGLSAEGWVYVGITIFLILAFTKFKFHRLIADALDKRIAEAKQQLEEAKAIRAEAEKLLADARARHAASAGDADAIIAHAEEEAKAMLAKAEKDAAELTVRRAKMAEDKIEAAERQALAEVRATAAEAAAKAAGTIIAQKHGADADKALVDRTIAGLNRLN